MSSHRIGVFVATMTGLAEICAEEVVAALQAQGLDGALTLMDGLGAEAVEDIDLIVIVSSTYGHGDIPDNGQAFYEALDGLDDLSGKHFVVFGLGDRTYADTFCHAGEKWDALLAAKGAARLFPLERHDASAGTLAEDIAGEWASRWMPLLEQSALS